MALTKEQVSKLYVAIFNRASEGKGNEYWQINQPDMATTADTMLNTDAAKEYFGDTLNTNQAFIEWIYKNTLNKTIDDDPGGIAYWVNKLDLGESKGQVVVDLINAIDSYSPGGKYYDPNNTKTVEAYNQFMNRVEVSNYTAEHIYEPPNDYKSKLGFDGELTVTYDDKTVSYAETIINNISSSSGSGTSSNISEITVTTLEEQPENTEVAAGTVVAKITPEAGTTYELTGDDASMFTLDERTGEIKVKDAYTPDFETDPSYDFTIKATDANGKEITKDITIKVKDIEPEGETFDLKPGKDELVAKDTNDIFNGVISSLSSERTLDPDDTIDGGKGDDTLNLDMKGNFSGLTKGSIKDIENINLTNNTTIARSFNATDISDVKVYTLDSAKAINLSNLVASDIEVSAKNFQNNFTIAFDSKTDLSGSSDKMALTFDGVGAAKVLDSDGVTVKTAENDVKVTMADIEEVTLKSQNSASFIDLSGVDATKYTVTGDKDLTISEVKDGLTSIDASAMSGKLSIDTTAITTASSLKEITGGSNDDTIAVDAADILANGTIVGGEGNDTLKLSDSAGSTIQPNMSGVENLEITGVATNKILTISSKDITDLTSITLDANSTDNGEVELVTQGSSDITVKTVGAINANQDLKLDTAGTVTFDITGKDAKKDAEEDAAGSITASNSTSLNMNVDKYMNFTGDIVAPKATSLVINSQGNINTYSDSNGQNALSDFSSLESLTITAGGSVNLKDTAKGLDKVASVTLSGAETTSAVTLGTVGNSATDYDVNLTSTGLKGGLTTGSITSKQNVNINLDGTTGNIALANGNDEKITSADNNLTINAKNLTGTLDTGAIIGKSVTIDTTDALKAVTIGTDDSAATTTDITVTDSLTYKAGLKGANTSNGIEIHTAATATATTLNLNGNIGDDKFLVTTEAASDTDISLTIKGDLGIGANSVTVDAANLDGTTGKTGKATIDLSGLKGSAATGATLTTITGSAQDDTIKVSAGADIVKFADSANNGTDIIIGLNKDDTLDFSAFLGTGKTINSTTTGIDLYSADSTGNADIIDKIVLFDNGGTKLDETKLLNEFTTGEAFSLSANGKAVIISGDKTDGTSGQVWYIDDTLGANTGTIEADDIVLVATLQDADPSGVYGL